MSDQNVYEAFAVQQGTATKGEMRLPDGQKN